MLDGSNVLECVVRRVRSAWCGTPRVGLLLGSGLCGLKRLIQPDVCIDYSQLPHFPRTSAAGHSGQLVCGRMNEVPVMAFVGRSHLYEGYCADELALPIRLLHALGASQLVLTNASGGLNPQFRRGDVMLIRDHLCFQFLELRAEKAPIIHSMRPCASAYDQSLAGFALARARHDAICLQQGIYVAVTGPNYETRAEYRMFRNLGGDAVGMSTAVEAVVAAQLGMRTVGLSMIANVALPDCPQRVTHEEVLAAGALAEPVMARMIQSLVCEFSD